MHPAIVWHFCGAINQVFVNNRFIVIAKSKCLFLVKNNNKKRKNSIVIFADCGAVIFAQTENNRIFYKNQPSELLIITTKFGSQQTLGKARLTSKIKKNLVKINKIRQEFTINSKNFLKNTHFSLAKSIVIV